PDVAERPQDLVVYGGTGKAARSWEAYDAIVRTLRTLRDDETLLVQSGKPVGVFRTHEMAPRVLISNSVLVPKWADWDTFRELEAAGLTMYGQMTAGSWIYIGTQGSLQGTYETLAECAHQRFGGTVEEAAAVRLADPAGYQGRAYASMADHVRAMAGFLDAGAVVFDYGNNLRAGAEIGGLAHDLAYAYPGFVPAFVRPLFCEGKGPF